MAKSAIEVRLPVRRAKGLIGVAVVPTTTETVDIKTPNATTVEDMAIWRRCVVVKVAKFSRMKGGSTDAISGMDSEDESSTVDTLFTLESYTPGGANISAAAVFLKSCRLTLVLCYFSSSA